MTENPSMFTFNFAAVTDIGCERSNNEDSYGYDFDQHLYVVCDGMGGGAAGEVASSMAVRVLIEAFGSHSTPIREDESIPVANRLFEAILETNRVLREAARENLELETMGTTLVCVCVDGNQTVIANVGDSRAYLIRDGNCTQVTQDHSYLAEVARAGEMSPESVADPNLQSVITRAIGVEDKVEPDFYAAQLQPDDVLLLASDGLTRYVLPEEILTTVESGADLTNSCQALIDIAKMRGGADNITCMLLRVVESSGKAGPNARGGSEGNVDSAPPDELEAFTPII